MPLTRSPSSGKPWTRKQDEQLRRTYTVGGMPAARTAFPGFSDIRIYRRAMRLGMAGGRNGRRKVWTAADDELLRRLWGSERIGMIPRMMGRTKAAVYNRARIIRLRLGCPQGLEYLTEAADRAGYQPETLRRILRFSRVRIMPAFSRLRSGKTFYRNHVVDPFDVDEAVVAWLKHETVSAAGRRHGVCVETMTRWLKHAGVKVRKCSARRAKALKFQHGIVEIAAVDQAVAARGRLESIVAAAARVGVHPGTMALWLKMAGVRRTGRVWLNAPEVIDAVVAQHRAAINTNTNSCTMGAP